MIDPRTPFGFIIIALACWRISAMLVREDGPGDIFAKLRMKAWVKYTPTSIAYSDKFLGKLLLCVWCVSVWVAPVVVLIGALNLGKIADYVMIALAVSAGAILVDSFTKK